MCALFCFILFPFVCFPFFFLNYICLTFVCNSLQGKIALGCATTNLAATNFENFFSMHALFGLPVLTEDEVEDNMQLNCRLDHKPQRSELIAASSLILIDEVI